ncbi:hypothetical protein HNQ59_000967 [Chitinivorax tropicus]|uniref:Uncharacterized protein n=1 Tax=Chitinivorax tropicus TaxID=714531 RepID=A0A840MGC4_9PROT|nr:hypothetical protein [Chitinivorax tropicus]MBB5017698.1 hypothetical protein [Chitinivorax tropicus]
MSVTVRSLIDFANHDLVFDDRETREILAYFWPSYTKTINRMAMSAEARRFAQQVLVCTIDANYAQGRIEMFSHFLNSRKPNIGLKRYAKKLADKHNRNWFRHASQKDLQNAEIYSTIQELVIKKYSKIIDDLLISEWSASA